VTSTRCPGTWTWPCGPGRAPSSRRWFPLPAWPCPRPRREVYPGEPVAVDHCPRSSTSDRPRSGPGEALRRQPPSPRSYRSARPARGAGCVAPVWQDVDRPRKAFLVHAASVPRRAGCHGGPPAHSREPCVGCQRTHGGRSAKTRSLIHALTADTYTHVLPDVTGLDETQHETDRCRSDPVRHVGLEPTTR
jgi:hypothetical protein